MISEKSFSLTAFLALAAVHAAANPLAVPQDGNAFSITGLVAHATPHSLILYRNDGPNLKILVDNGPVPARGDRAILSVRTKYTRFNEPDHHLEDFKVIGSGQIPEPSKASVEDLVERTITNERITVEAEVEDYFIDEVDARFYYLALKSGPHRTYGATDRTHADAKFLEGLIGATVRLTGLILEQRGARRFVGNRISFSLNDLEIVKPAEKDLSLIPELDLERYWLPMELARLSRRRICGKVLAVWQHGRIIVRTTGGQTVGAALLSSGSLPSVGDQIIVAGYPATDFFRISLTGAKWQPGSPVPVADSATQELFGGELFTDIHGNHSINALYHGANVSIRGTVMRGGDRELEIDLGQDTIKAYAGEESSGFESIESGSKVELSGIAVIESDFWHEGTTFPRIRGVSIVTRRDNDVKVLCRPPWWTPTRVFSAFAGFLLLVAGLAVWNRILMRIAKRRSREFAREQLAKERSELKTDERTRLAIELHDSLSQNLSGIGCQLVAARLAMKPGDLASVRLETAERMLQSTRTELKRCLFDLREDLLGDMDFEHALCQTLRSIAGACTLNIKFHVARSVMDDSRAHTILSVIRELVSNAVRHGHATSIDIAGSLEQRKNGSCILFSVRDNGIGFDPETCDGPADGHFGLTGVHDRINRTGGVFHIESAPGATYARASIPL